MSHAPFSPGDKVEFAGSHLGQVADGPEVRDNRGPCYLVEQLENGGGPAAWMSEAGMHLADMAEWVPAGQGRWKRRTPVLHLAVKGALIGQPLLCCGKATGSLPGRDIVTRNPAKVTCTSRKPAVRYYCQHRGNPAAGLHHSEGNGTPTRRFCAGCHSELITAQGLWGVFRWRGDSRYPWEDALATYTRADIADQRAVSSEAKQDAPEHGGWVVRWILLRS